MAAIDTMFLIEIVVENINSFVDSKNMIVQAEFADIFSFNIKDPKQIDFEIPQPPASPTLAGKGKKGAKGAKADKKGGKGKKNKGPPPPPPDPIIQSGQSCLFPSSADILKDSMDKNPLILSLWSKEDTLIFIGSARVTWSTSFYEFLKKSSDCSEFNPPNNVVHKDLIHIFEEETAKLMATVTLQMKISNLKDKIVTHYKVVPAPEDEGDAKVKKYVYKNADRPTAFMCQIKSTGKQIEKSSFIKSEDQPSAPPPKLEYVNYNNGPETCFTIAPETEDCCNKFSFGSGPYFPGNKPPDLEFMAEYIKKIIKSCNNSLRMLTPRTDLRPKIRSTNMDKPCHCLDANANWPDNDLAKRMQENKDYKEPCPICRYKPGGVSNKIDIDQVSGPCGRFDCNVAIELRAYLNKISEQDNKLVNIENILGPCGHEKCPLVRKIQRFLRKEGEFMKGKNVPGMATVCDCESKMKEAPNKVEKSGYCSDCSEGNCSRHKKGYSTGNESCCSSNEGGNCFSDFNLLDMEHMDSQSLYFYKQTNSATNSYNDLSDTWEENDFFEIKKNKKITNSGGLHFIASDNFMQESVNETLKGKSIESLSEKITLRDKYSNENVFGDEFCEEKKTRIEVNSVKSSENIAKRKYCGGNCVKIYSSIENINNDIENSVQSNDRNNPYESYCQEESIDNKSALSCCISHCSEKSTKSDTSTNESGTKNDAMSLIGNLLNGDENSLHFIEDCIKELVDVNCSANLITENNICEEYNRRNENNLGGEQSYSYNLSEETLAGFERTQVFNNQYSVYVDSTVEISTGAKCFKSGWSENTNEDYKSEDNDLEIKKSSIIRNNMNPPRSFCSESQISSFPSSCHDSSYCARKDCSVRDDSGDDVDIDVNDIQAPCLDQGCNVAERIKEYLQEQINDPPKNKKKSDDQCYCDCECRFGFKTKTTFCFVCGGYEIMGDDLKNTPPYAIPVPPCPIYHKSYNIKPGDHRNTRDVSPVKGPASYVSESKKTSRKSSVSAGLRETGDKKNAEKKSPDRKLPEKKAPEKKGDAKVQEKKETKEINKVEKKSENKKKGKFTFNYGCKGVAAEIGHGKCNKPRLNVPKHMGWLWNAEDIPGMKPRPEWRPGAATRYVVRKYRAFLNPDNLPGKKRQLKKIVKNKYQKKPTVVIEKRDGEFKISIEEIKKFNKPRLISQYPYEDSPPHLYTVGRTDEENEKRRKRFERRERRKLRRKQKYLQQSFKNMCEDICLKAYRQAVQMMPPDKNSPECPCLPENPDIVSIGLDSCSCSEESLESKNDTDGDDWVVEFTPPIARYDPENDIAPTLKSSIECQYEINDFKVKVLGKDGKPVPRHFIGPDGKKVCSDLGGFMDSNGRWLKIGVDGYIGKDGRWVPKTFIGPNGQIVDTEDGTFRSENGQILRIGIDGYIGPKGTWIPYKVPLDGGIGRAGVTGEKDGPGLDELGSETEWSCFARATTPFELAERGIVAHGRDKKTLAMKINEAIAMGAEIQAPVPSKVPKSPVRPSDASRKKMIPKPFQCQHPIPSDKGVIGIDNVGDKEFFRIKFENNRSACRLEKLKRQGISVCPYHIECHKSFIGCKKYRELLLNKIFGLKRKKEAV